MFSKCDYNDIARGGPRAEGHCHNIRRVLCYAIIRDRCARAPPRIVLVVIAIGSVVPWSVAEHALRGATIHRRDHSPSMTQR